jgi:hypothetical protein
MFMMQLPCATSVSELCHHRREMMSFAIIWFRGLSAGFIARR